MKLEYFFFGIFALLLAATGMLAMHYRGELQYERRLNELRMQAPAVPAAPAVPVTPAPAASPAAAADAALQRQLELAEAEQQALAAQAQVRTAPKSEVKVEDTEIQKRIQEAPVVARITEYVADQGIAALDQGSNQNLKTGQVYAVRRGKYLITKKLTIGELVEPTECAAVVDASSLPPGEVLRPGDEVIQWEE